MCVVDIEFRLIFNAFHSNRSVNVSLVCPQLDQHTHRTRITRAIVLSTSLRINSAHTTRVDVQPKNAMRIKNKVVALVTATIVAGAY